MIYLRGINKILSQNLSGQLFAAQCILFNDTLIEAYPGTVDRKVLLRGHRGTQDGGDDDNQ